MRNGGVRLCVDKFLNPQAYKQKRASMGAVHRLRGVRLCVIMLIQSS